MSATDIRQRERRRHERVAVRFPVEARAAGAAPLRGLCLNLSASGALVALPAPLPLGDEVDLTLELPDGGEPLTLRALALRMDGDPGAPPPHRVGVHFILANADDIRRLRSLIHDR